MVDVLCAAYELLNAAFACIIWRSAWSSLSLICSVFFFWGHNLLHSNFPCQWIKHEKNIIKDQLFFKIEEWNAWSDIDCTERKEGGLLLPPQSILLSPFTSKTISLSAAKAVRQKAGLSAPWKHFFCFYRPASLQYTVISCRFVAFIR